MGTRPTPRKSTRFTLFFVTRPTQQKVHATYSPKKVGHLRFFLHSTYIFLNGNGSSSGERMVAVVRGSWRPAGGGGLSLRDSSPWTSSLQRVVVAPGTYVWGALAWPCQGRVTALTVWRRVCEHHRNDRDTVREGSCHMSFPSRRVPTFALRCLAAEPLNDAVRLVSCSAPTRIYLGVVLAASWTPPPQRGLGPLLRGRGVVYQPEGPPAPPPLWAAVAW